MSQQSARTPDKLAPNEFRVADLAPGQSMEVDVDDEGVAVFNVDGTFYATQNACTHAEGPLSEGTFSGVTVICPWHDSCFDVTTGAATCKPATEPLKLYRVIIDGEIARVVPPA